MKLMRMPSLKCKFTLFRDPEWKVSQPTVCGPLFYSSEAVMWLDWLPNLSEIVTPYVTNVTCWICSWVYKSGPKDSCSIIFVVSFTQIFEKCM